MADLREVPKTINKVVMGLRKEGGWIELFTLNIDDGTIVGDVIKDVLAHLSSCQEAEWVVFGPTMIRVSDFISFTVK